MEKKALESLKTFSDKSFVRKRIWQTDKLHCNIDLIGDRVAVKAVLLARLEAVDVAVELISLPDPLPNKTVV